MLGYVDEQKQVAKLHHLLQYQSPPITPGGVHGHTVHPLRIRGHISLGGLSLSVSGPHRGGQRPSLLAKCVHANTPQQRWRNPLQRSLGFGLRDVQVQGYSEHVLVVQGMICSQAGRVAATIKAALVW